MSVFLKKALSFIKNYWFVLFAIPVVILLFVLKRKKDADAIVRLIDNAYVAHKAEIRVIEAADKERVAATNAAIKRMHDAEVQLRAELERNLRELDAKQEKRASQIIKQFKDDPHKLSNELEREFGVRVIVVD
jgi:hypothetical protein